MGQRLGSSPELRSNNGDSLIHLCSYAIYPYNASNTTQQQKNAKGKRGDMEVYKKAFASLVMVHKNA